MEQSSDTASVYSVVCPVALKFAVLFNDRAKALALAKDLRGQLFVDERELEENAQLAQPFRALVTCVTDDLNALISLAEVGAYLVAERVMKARTKEQSDSAGPLGIQGIFPMVARSDMTPTESDCHWREIHGPLALKVHVAMSDYRQLCILQRFSGPEWHGIALCGFRTLEDLRLHFYVDEAGKDLIARDVRNFADVRSSPGRVIAAEYQF